MYNRRYDKRNNMNKPKNLFVEEDIYEWYHPQKDDTIVQKEKIK